jgi:hypothetical protein
LRDGKQIDITGATFVAAKFNRTNPQHPVHIGDEYPPSVHFEGEEPSTYYDLSWNQVKSISPLASNGLVDCSIVTKTGRTVSAWANYWWTASRIQGIAPFGSYRLLLMIDYSATGAKDYEKIDLL